MKCGAWVAPIGRTLDEGLPMNDQTITDYWRLELLGANDRFRRRYRRRAVIRAGLWLTVALAVVVVLGRLTATHPAFLIAEGVIPLP